MCHCAKFYHLPDSNLFTESDFVMIQFITKTEQKGIVLHIYRNRGAVTPHVIFFGLLFYESTLKNHFSKI